jgi:hypothetical protein
MVSLGVGFLLVLLSIVGAWHAVGMNRSAKLELKWVAVRGRVTRSTVQLISGNFEPVVEYSYSFAGVTLTGNKLRSTGVSTESRGPAEVDVARYPSGMEITIFVNPDIPTDSVIEPGPKKWHLTAITFSCAFGVCWGLAMIVQALK